jgi:rod shape determining protein RodA
MNIGFAPVIGIPLPLFSYGGSSMMSFSVMLFILLKLDAQRKEVLR